MSIPRLPGPGKLVVSLLGKTDERILEVRDRMEREFGRADFTSDLLPFHWTDYYQAEFGAPLVRRFLSFEPLMEQDKLVEAKIRTNEIERDFSETGMRTVNLDPGILTQARLVLATGKDHAHRIYLGEGIFADLTLIYRNKSFRPLAWTFPDYADETIIRLMNGIRDAYSRQMKARVSEEVQ